MAKWIKTKDKLPEKNKWVDVKDPLVKGEIAHALLVDTKWGTTEWLYAGIINMDINMIEEWFEDGE